MSRMFLGKCGGSYVVSGNGKIHYIKCEKGKNFTFQSSSRCTQEEVGLRHFDSMCSDCNLTIRVEVSIE